MLQIVWIARVRRWLKRMQARRATIRQLSAMPRSTLEDIGVPRERIREVVDQMLAAQEREETAATAEGAYGRCGRETVDRITERRRNVPSISDN